MVIGVYIYHPFSYFKFLVLVYIFFQNYRRQREAEANGMKGMAAPKRKTAMDILLSDEKPSAKELKYICMQRMVNGTFLYLNDGRQWEAERRSAMVRTILVQMKYMFNVF